MLGITVLIASGFSPSGPATSYSRRVALRTTAVVAEELVLERAPPAPPPTTDGGGGGGGGDGSSSEFLRLLNAAEQASVLEDWVSRTRIYRMTDTEDLVTAHTEALVEIEELQNFDTTGPSGEGGRKMVLGLFKDDNISGLAGAEVSHEAGLVISSLIVYPAELNDPSSTAALRLIHALYLLADAIDAPLDMSPVNAEGCEPSCITVRSGMAGADGEPFELNDLDVDS